MSLTKMMLDSIDDINEEDYYFYQQQMLNEEWHWYEHSISLKTDEQASSNDN